MSFFSSPACGASLKGIMKKKKEAWQKSAFDAILHHIYITLFGDRT